jgi:hypothetical protein
MRLRREEGFEDVASREALWQFDWPCQWRSRWELRDLVAASRITSGHLCDLADDGQAIVGRGGGGFGHLGRSEDAVTLDQLRLLAKTDDKKIVLTTHFTLVSYHDTIACGDKMTSGLVKAGTIQELGHDWPYTQRGKPFSYYDWGTFEQARAALYGLVAKGGSIACVISGHSHRKGLYLLGPADGHCYRTEAYALSDAHGPVDGVAAHTAGRTPMVVSDCSGPLPRMNLNNEFGEWGSNRPSGTIVHVSGAGSVTNIEVVSSQLATSKPRLAVAVDYLHFKAGHVFKAIRVTPFERAKAHRTNHEIEITFDKYFPESIARGMDLILFGHPVLTQEWTRLSLHTSRFETAGGCAKATFTVAHEDRRLFYPWLTLGSRSGRFMSFGFSSAGGLEDIYDISTRWNLEVDATPGEWDSRGLQTFEIVAHRHFGWRRDDVHDGHSGLNPGELRDELRNPESPDFTWRKRFAPYQ